MRKQSDFEFVVERDCQRFPAAGMYKPDMAPSLTNNPVSNLLKFPDGLFSGNTGKDTHTDEIGTR